MQFDQVKVLKEQIRQYEQRLDQLLKERQELDGRFTQMAQLMTSLDIENDTQKKHIQELEQFVLLLSTALTPADDQ